jgi:TonB-linked SusC/RagA family outer membrane protein
VQIDNSFLIITNFTNQIKIMIKNCLIIIFCISGMSLMAQTKTISGIVLDGSNQIPLPNAEVKVKGTDKGTATNFDGEFTLEGVNEDATLIVSYLGFKTQEVSVAGKTELTINLQPDQEALEDVIVVGYGKSSRRNITGSVSSISSESIQDLEPVNTAQALQGTAAGVNVTPQGGTPGAESNIRIRGIATNGDNAPLIILDGFQYDGGLNSLNPNDIESITVLKGAEAAIYGSIGSNGVVLIETKNGDRNQDPVINYNTYFGIQETTRELPLLNSTEYALLLNESYANAGQTLPFPNLSSIENDTDWQGQIFSAVPIMSHNISISGGSENTDYIISASHLDQEGIVGDEKSSFKRTTAKISLNTDVRDNFKVSTNVLFTNNRSNEINSFGLGSVLFNALNIAPVISPDQDNLDGTIDLGNEVINPITQLEQTYNDVEANRLSGNISAELEYIDGFTLTGRYGFNYVNTSRRDFFPAFDYGTSKIFTRTQNQVNLNKQEFYDYTFDLFNTIDKTFNDVHEFEFTTGMTVFRAQGNGIFGSRTDVPGNSFEFADLGTATGAGENQTNGSFVSEVRRLSYFGRLNYTFDDKYLVSAILRRDTSLRFGPNNKTGYFPSISGGWIASEESFFPDIDQISYFKIRGSYGELGNDRIGDFLYLGLLDGEATYVLGQDQSLTNGQALGALPNPNVKWETAKKFNVGFDSELFDNDLSITLDYYRNTRSDLLIPSIPVSGIFGTAAPGASSPTINAGTVVNKGFEGSISYGTSINDDWSFSASYNFSTIDNEVTKVNGTDFIEGGAFGVGQQPPSRMEEGLPIGYFFGLQTDGIFQNQAEVDAHADQTPSGAAASPGDLRFVDINNDGVIDDNDRTNIGDPIPDVTMGINLSVNYKNFNFKAYAFANVGNEIVRNYERDQVNVNKLRYRLNRWTGEGSTNVHPRVTAGANTNRLFSDYFVEDGSFLRIQTMSLGYNLPVDLVDKLGLSNVKFYTKVDNIFTFTEYSGYDPTASTGAPIGGGIDLGFYPLPRTYSLGMNVKF